MNNMPALHTFLWAFADGPYAVVLAPTRELAQQIEEETVKLAKYTDFKWVHMLAVLCAVLVCISFAQLDYLWWVRQPNARPSACCCLVPSAIKQSISCCSS
jgi:hypothetical protein